MHDWIYHYSLYFYIWEHMCFSFKLTLNADGAKRQNGLLFIIAIEKITTLSKSWTTCTALNNEDAVNVLLSPSCCRSHKGVSELLKAEQKKKENKSTMCTP